MKRLTFTVEPGETIEDAAEEAQRIADATSWTVFFEFNSVDCFAVPGGDPVRLVENQQQMQSTRPRAFSDERTA